MPVARPESQASEEAAPPRVPARAVLARSMRRIPRRAWWLMGGCALALLVVLVVATSRRERTPAAPLVAVSPAPPATAIPSAEETIPPVRPVPVAPLTAAPGYVPAPAPAAARTLAATASAPKTAPSTVVSPAAAAPARGLPNPDRLRLEGVTVQPEDHGLTLKFRNGLFVRGAELSPEGTSLLLRLAREIKPHAGGVRLTIIGYTDNQPPRPGSGFKDNRELGLLRARAVESLLRTRAGWPADGLGVTSPGAQGAPYLNDTPQNRARNRTVVLRIVPR